MLCFILLGSAILVMLDAHSSAVPQPSLRMLHGTSRPIGPQCWGPGTWPHPVHCRLFSICHLSPDGGIVGQLFLCPLGSSYSSRIQSCITMQAMMPDCATSVEDDFLLDSLPAETLSSKAASQFTCEKAQVPYCVNNETLVICAPNKALVGVVNCSAQHWAKKGERLQCDRNTNRCAVSSVRELQHAAPDTEESQTSAKSFSAESVELLDVSQNPSGTETAFPNTSLPDSHAKNNRTQGTSTNLQLETTMPDTSNESDYSNELYDGDDEYEVYDLEGSLPNYADIKCTQKGLQCADKMTIMDCSKNLTEPLFIMSCSSLLHSDDGENAVGHCDNETRSCILTSQNMSLLLSVNTVITGNLKVCETYSGLQCVDNETLVACSGDSNSTQYTVSCNGEVISDTSSFIQGHCYENSCMFVIAHQANNSDIHAEGSENYVPDYLLTSDTNSAIHEPLYKNTNVTHVKDEHEEPDILSQQVEVFDLYDEYNAFKHNLTKAEEEYIIDDYDDTEMHTRNSSSSGDNDLITGAAGNILQITQDDLLHTDSDLTSTEGALPNTREPHLHYELVSPHIDNTSKVTNPAKTGIYSQTSSLLSLDQMSTSASQTRLSTSTITLIKTTSQIAKSIPTETIPFVYKLIPTETTRPTSKSIPTRTVSNIPENLTETIYSVFETITETISSVPETITETISAVPESITGTVSSVLEAVGETISSALETITETIFLIPETILPTETTATSKFIPTGAASTIPETIYKEMTTSASEYISGETASPTTATTPTETINPLPEHIAAENNSSIPETVHTETILYVLKTTHRETASPVPETIDTETMNPASKIIHRETAFHVAETAPIHTTMPVSQTFHGETASPVPETIHTETMTPASKFIYGETAFSVPETEPTYTTMPFSQTFHGETASPVPETIHTETMTPATKLIHGETTFSVAETAPTYTTKPFSQTFHGETASPVPETIYTETMTPVSKLIHRDTTFSAAETVPIETMTSVSQNFHGETASPVLQNIHTEAMTPVSKFIQRETAFSVPETVSSEATISISETFHGGTVSPIPEIIYTELKIPVSKFIHSVTTSPSPEGIYAETMNPISKLNHRETAHSISETVSTEATKPVSDGKITYPIPVTVHTEIHRETASSNSETVATETTIPVSQTISRETASPVLEIVHGKTTKVNSDTTVPTSHITLLVSDTSPTNSIVPVSNLIPMLNTQEAGSDSIAELHFNLQASGTASTAELLSEALIPQPTVDMSGFKSTTMSAIAETEQPEHLVSVSSQATNDVSNVHQKHVCQKAGIQCMDNLTLAACMPDLTLSYTVSCQTLLPYMTSKHHTIYCDQRLDTCALAPLKDSFN